MRVLHERCCGLDIHKKFVVACLLRTNPDGSVCKDIRSYSTMTHDLLALCDWLRAEQCTPVGDAHSDKSSDLLNKAGISFAKTGPGVE